MTDDGEASSPFAAKLRRLQADRGSFGERAAPGGFREWLQRRQSERRREAVPVALPDGVEVTAGDGCCFVRRLRYPLTFRHGNVPLATAVETPTERFAALAKDPSFADLDPRACLFLDTETTGLAGGAGTIVFLCGLAWIEADEVVVEQVFLRAFAEENAALVLVAERIAQRPTLVTYVGKSFDRHRIAARMAVQRITSGVLTPRHLDLYHLCRRAHRGAWPDFKLRTVERGLLGLVRESDLPGSEAPAAFLSWLRDRTGPVDRVFEHNRLDVLSLVALFGVVGTPRDD
jgi:uncharacterized protein YprB with RNaseH-like and TPR domain